MGAFDGMSDDLPFGTSDQAMRGKLETIEALRRFIEAGRATMTVQSKKTGVRFTFKFSQPKTSSRPGPKPLFVSLMNGQDNESSYEFIGTIFRTANGYEYHHSLRARTGPTAPSVAAVRWMCRGLNLGPEVLMKHADYWHEGRCGRCGRKLTVPSSIASGFGPECEGRMS